MNRYIIIILLLIGTANLQAQRKMTLEECRQMAIQQNEEMNKAQIQINKAKEEQAAMKTQYLPKLSGSVTGVYLKDDIKMELYLPTVTPDLTTGALVPNIMINPETGAPVMGADGNPVFNMYAWLPLEISLKGAYMAGLSLEQPLYTGGKIVAGNNLTKIGVEMATENMEMQRMKALYEADQTYWLYVSVNEKVKLAKKYNQLLDRLVQTVQDAQETGMITRNEVLKVKVKQNEAKLQLQKAKSGLELTRMALCRVTGLDFSTPIEAIDTVLMIETDNKIDAGNLDVSNRPEYRLLQKNIEFAAEKVKLAKADYLPTAGVMVGYNYIGGIDFGTSAYSSGNASVMASVKIPIFHWGEGKHKTQSAQLDQEMKKTELNQNSRLMMLEIAQSQFNLTDSYARVALAQESLVQAEENLRVSKDNYELGIEVLTSLLEAQTQWQQAYSENIDAKADCKLKETSYQKAIGTLK